MKRESFYLNYLIFLAGFLSGTSLLAKPDSQICSLIKQNLQSVHGFDWLKLQEQNRDDDLLFEVLVELSTNSQIYRPKLNRATERKTALQVLSGIGILFGGENSPYRDRAWKVINEHRQNLSKSLDERMMFLKALSVTGREVAARELIKSYETENDELGIMQVHSFIEKIFDGQSYEASSQGFLHAQVGFNPNLDLPAKERWDSDTYEKLESRFRSAIKKQIQKIKENDLMINLPDLEKTLLKLGKQDPKSVLSKKLKESQDKRSSVVKGLANRPKISQSELSEESLQNDVNWLFFWISIFSFLILIWRIYSRLKNR